MISVYLIEYTDLQQAKEKILSRYSNLKGETYSLDYLPTGAPQLIANSKQKGHVSISHTDGVLAMAFSNNTIGVDIERADRQVSPKVCESIDKWTRVEAYAKWTGLGLSREILNNLPDDMIITKEYGQYVISVCSKAKDFEIITLT